LYGPWGIGSAKVTGTVILRAKASVGCSSVFVDDEEPFVAEATTIPEKFTAAASLPSWST
jgi:carbonic anhydrase/acetyltransferase-like protein (isoleucine patch superfamily)